MPMQAVTPSTRRRILFFSCLAFVCTLLLAALAGHHKFQPNLLSLDALTTSVDVTGGTAAIIMIDTRTHEVPLDSEVDVPFWTIALLHNYLYAKSIGVPFMSFSLDPVMQDDGVTPRMDDGSDIFRLPAYCKHPEFGFRMVAFCKLLVIWHVWQTYPRLENIVMIDSDAVFKSRHNHVQSHLDLLSRRHPLGFLSDRPYDQEACAGYWFTTRGAAQIPSRGDVVKSETGVEFLEDWWNGDWAATGYKYDREQGILKKMIKDRKDTDQVNALVLKDEWQFEDKSPDQMVVHINHLQKGNQSPLLAKYFDWPSYSLKNNRERLHNLFTEIKTTTVDLGPVAAAVKESSSRRMHGK